MDKEIFVETLIVETIDDEFGHVIIEKRDHKSGIYDLDLPAYVVRAYKSGRVLYKEWWQPDGRLGRAGGKPAVIRSDDQLPRRLWYVDGENVGIEHPIGVVRDETGEIVHHVYNGKPYLYDSQNSMRTPHL